MLEMEKIFFYILIGLNIVFGYCFLSGHKWAAKLLIFLVKGTED